MLTNQAKAFIHSQQYGLVKKGGVKTKNPYKHLQIKGVKNGNKKNK